MGPELLLELLEPLLLLLSLVELLLPSRLDLAMVIVDLLLLLYVVMVVFSVRPSDGFVCWVATSN